MRNGITVLFGLICGLLLALPALSQVAELIKPGVVTISAHSQGRVNHGTGFVVDRESDIIYVVTAAHVVEGATDISLRFSSQPSKDVPTKVFKMEGGDPHGLAILTVSSVPPTHALNVSAALPVAGGDDVLIVGSPPTTGPLTVVKSSVKALEGRNIVVSGAFDAGFSGSPVISDGQVIGMLTTTTASSGYAVPSAIILQFLDAGGVPHASHTTVLDTGNFQFRLLACRAMGTVVTCQLKVLNRTPEDRTLYIASAQSGGISSLALHSLGVTTLIDANGVKHPATSVDFADQSGAENGQSEFTVYADTTPTLTLTFQNVGISVAAVRLDVVAGEATSKGVASIPIHFFDVPILRQSALISSPHPIDKTVDPRFIVEGLSWRLTLNSCRRIGDGVVCICVATNLSDSKNGLYFNWRGDGGIRATYLDNENSSAIDMQGKAFQITRLFYSFNHGEKEDTGNGQCGYAVDPFSELRLRLFISGVPPNAAKIARLNLVVGHISINGGQRARIPVRFLGIPIT